MKKLLLCLLLFLLITPPAYAAPEEALLDAADGLSEESLQGVQAILADFDYKEAVKNLSANADTGLLQRLWQGIGNFVLGEVRAGVRLPLSLAVLSALSGLLEGITPKKNGTAAAGFFICYAVVIGIAVSGASLATERAEAAAEDMGIFTQTALPAMATMAAALGGVSAAAIHPMMLAAVSGASLLVSRVGIPALYISLALAVVGNLSGRLSLRALSALVRKTALWLVCGSFTLFSAILGVTGYAAGTLDGVTAKAVKYAASSLVPVLGSLLAESADAVSFSALAVKNAAGVAGMVLIILLLLYPLLKILILSLFYRLAAAVTEPIGDKRICASLTDIADTMGALSGMTAALGVLAIIVMGILLKCGDMGVMLR
ncbi:MAG: stage III sporulation protein AE [Clostridia bacterium]|nr:stage III sporulation protein AE [Clostridia bacterium]